MNILEILDLLTAYGAKFDQSDLFDIIAYFDAMIADHRIIGIDEDGKLIAILAVSVCEDVQPYYEKKLWHYRSHDPKGSIAYFEKLIAIKWNRDIRNLTYDQVISLFPSVRYGSWHRPRKETDDLIQVTRRLENVSSENSYQ